MARSHPKASRLALEDEVALEYFMNSLNFIDHRLVGTPYGVALDLCIVLAIACWVLSILTREYSWVDRLWSVVPAVYCLIVASDLEYRSTRVSVMTVLATMWAIRLTFNYASQGRVLDRRRRLSVDLSQKTDEQPAISTDERDCRCNRSDGGCVAVHLAHSSGLGVCRATHGLAGFRCRRGISGIADS